jgi:hypothetical protein
LYSNNGDAAIDFIARVVEDGPKLVEHILSALSINFAHQVCAHDAIFLQGSADTPTNSSSVGTLV